MPYIFIDKGDDGKSAMRSQMREEMRRNYTRSGRRYYGGNRDNYTHGGGYEEGYRHGYKHGWEDCDEDGGEEEYRQDRDGRGRYM